MYSDPPFLHETAVVDSRAQLGPSVRIWHWTAVREGAQIGPGTSIGQCCYIDHDVRIGVDCRIQNSVSIYHGVELGDRVFVGPNVSFTNDRYPRADNLDWETIPTTVHDGASIGANATIVCGVILGERCMVGAGAVVTRDVPPYGLVIGHPARLVGYVTDVGQPSDAAPNAHHPPHHTRHE